MMPYNISSPNTFQIEISPGNNQTISQQQYCHKTSKMAIDDIVAAVPKPVTVGFAALGALWLGRKVISYIALLLDLFILSGTNVRITLCRIAFPNSNCLEYGLTYL